MNVLDTYALMEISKGNEEYLNLKKYPFYIPETTIAEFYGVVIREHNKQTADYWLKKLGPFIRSTNLHVFIQASIYKHKHNKQKLSFFDCVGYCSALENKATFVTGDKEFANKPHVTFIK